MEDFNTKKEFTLMLESGGFVVFSPQILQNFIEEKSINNQNLLEHFVNHPKDGDEVITSGITIPVYPIPVQDYLIIVTNELESEDILPNDWILFKHEFPIKIEDNEVIISDIYAILNWNINDWVGGTKKYSDFGMANNFSLKNRNYLMQVIGFCQSKNDPQSKFGYILKFEETENFNLFEVGDRSIEDLNFTVVPDKLIAL